jgi:uncharacterized protein YcnI
MQRTTINLAATVTFVAIVPAVAQAHASLHPNAIPAGPFATTNIRVPNEEAHASTTSVRAKLPAGVLSALGAPPAGRRFSPKTRKLAKPIKTDDGIVSTVKAAAAPAATVVKKQTGGLAVVALIVGGLALILGALALAASRRRDA